MRLPKEPNHPTKYVRSEEYNEPITGTLRRMFSKFSMNVFVRVKTIKNILINSRDPITQEQKIKVYEIPIPISERELTKCVGGTKRSHGERQRICDIGKILQ